MRMVAVALMSAFLLAATMAAANAGSAITIFDAGPVGAHDMIRGVSGR